MIAAPGLTRFLTGWKFWPIIRQFAVVGDWTDTRGLTPRGQRLGNGPLQCGISHKQGVTEMTSIFGRRRPDGLVNVLETDGSIATRLDASLYCVEGWTVEGEFFRLGDYDLARAACDAGQTPVACTETEKSTRYEHPEGVVLTQEDAAAIGLTIED